MATTNPEFWIYILLTNLEKYIFDLNRKILPCRKRNVKNIGDKKSQIVIILLHKTQFNCGKIKINSNFVVFSTKAQRNFFFWFVSLFILRKLLWCFVSGNDFLLSIWLFARFKINIVTKSDLTSLLAKKARL